MAFHWARWRACQVDLVRLRRWLVTWLFGSRWAGARRSRWLVVGLWSELLLGLSRW